MQMLIGITKQILIIIRIRYKLIGATSWSYKNNIDSLAITENSK